MLYNKNWDRTETKPDVFSLASLIAWLEKMPGDGAYKVFPLSTCMLGQFAAAMGAVDLIEASLDLGSTAKFAHIAFPLNVRDLTFGAALDRARKTLSPSNHPGIERR